MSKGDFVEFAAALRKSKPSVKDPAVMRVWEETVDAVIGVLAKRSPTFNVRKFVAAMKAE